MDTISQCSLEDKFLGKVFVAGHKGMVGSAIVRRLQKDDVEIIIADSKELDLINQSQVKKFFNDNEISEVYLAAAKVGGIYANNIYPADFIYQNSMIQNNIIHESFLSGVSKLLFLGSSCIYPRLANQPIKEDELMNGHLESTNEPYAIAKISGIKMCESYHRQFGCDYRSIMPTNLYGPGDNYHPENSHVIPGLIRRFHEAKIQNYPEVIAWGTGTPLREFMHVDDLASAAIYIMSLSRDSIDSVVSPMNSHINVGSGKEFSIKTLTQMIAEVVGYTGTIIWDPKKPDGSPRKIMDNTRIASLGWQASIDLKVGLDETYECFLNKIAKRS